MVSDARDYESLPPCYYRLIRAWVMLGTPAFVTVIAPAAIMMFKPGMA
jgi:uncharacterized membrane protein